MPATNGVLIGWNRVVPGKEEQAVALFAEAMEFWAQQQRTGAIESCEPVFLAPHGGELNGFFLVRGDPDKLNQVMDSDAYLLIETKATNWLQDHGVIRASFGEAIKHRMAVYQKVADGG